MQLYITMKISIIDNLFINIVNVAAKSYGLSKYYLGFGVVKLFLKLYLLQKH